MSPRKKGSKAGMIAGAIVVLALVGAFVGAVIWSQQLPEGPVEIVWDKEACSHCHMHVGEPGFAAQVQLSSGKVHNFDDPGCLFEWLKAHRNDAVHALYFHHYKEDRWLTADEVGFIETSPTPMGFGLGAVEKSTPGAIGLEQAKAKIEQRGHPGEEQTTWR